MLDAENHVWNAGIFLFRASAMLAHAKILPDMLVAVETAIDDARQDNNFWHIGSAPWVRFRVVG